MNSAAHSVFFTCVLIAAWHAPVSAAPAPPCAVSGTVARIAVTGNASVTARDISARMLTATGCVYSLDAVNADIHRLMQLRAFENVTMIAQQTDPGNIHLTCRVREFPRVSTFTLIHDQKHPLNLKSLFTTQTGRPFDPSTWRRDLQRVRAFLQSNDYHGVDIRTHKNMAPDRKTVALTVQLHEGIRQALEAIELRGVHAMSARTILSYLHCRPKNKMLFRDGSFDLDRLHDDAGNLRAAYRDEGYLAAAISTAFRTGSAPSLAVLELTVAEGPQCMIDSIAWTQRVMSSGEFARIISSVDEPVREPYSPKRQAEFKTEIEEECAGYDAGPLDARVQALVSPRSTAEQPLVDFVVIVKPEGQRRAQDFPLFQPAIVPALRGH
jgi:outer membrane protein assembly factor BamA